MKTPQWFLKRNIMTWLLWPLSVLYFWVHGIIYLFRKFNQKSSKIPVICVGGLLAGGVGKTPVVKEVADKLGAPVIMRGFGGHTNSRSILVTKKTDVTVSGDEAKMLSNNGISVYVGNRRASIARINAADCACAECPGAIIMDDGFQNPTIKKDISILVFDGKIGIGSGFVLPAGPLREPLYFGIKRCDAIIIIGDMPADDASIPAWLHGIKKPVFYAKKFQKAGKISGRVIAFAGIGYPQKFFDSVNCMDRVKLIEAVSFPDHHFYTAADLKRLFKLAKKYNARLLTTEKDWVKIPAYLQKKIQYSPMELCISDDFWKWLDKKLNDKTKG